MLKVHFTSRLFSKPVIDTLANLGVEAKFTGRNDLEIDGKKFCGNAQAYYNGRMMHHGCLLFDVDMIVLGNALKVSKDKIESKGVKSVRARVTNILSELFKPMTVNEFADAILDQMKKEYPDVTEYVLSDEDKAKIQKSCDEQFSTCNWNFGTSPKYTLTRAVRYPAGKSETFIDAEGSIIKGIKIFGDFFGIKPAYEIENLLIGTRYEYQDVLAKLQMIDTSEYFSGMTSEEVAKAIVA